MQKKTALLFLLLLLTLTSCTSNENIPIDSNDTNSDSKEKIGTNINIPKETTQGSIDIISSEDPSKDSPDENDNTMENPKEALTKILTELQELDELLNGTD